MPWNEPGSDDKKNPKDPWGKQEPNQQQGQNNGQRGNPQGPPDLDKVIRDIKDKIGASLGGVGSGSGGRGASGSGNGKTAGFGLFFLIGIVALGFWLASGIYTVDQGKQGVELRFGEFKRITGAGLHWHFPPPIETRHVLDVSRENTVEVGYRSRGSSSHTSVPQEALMLTKDENIIDIQFAVQYEIKSPTALIFNVAEPIETVVRQATESAVRETIGKNNMDFAITDGRSVIASETQALLQQILDRYESGIQIRSVEMQNAQPPAQVKDAFDDVVRAREDEQRLKNLAEAYANDLIPRARGKAARITEEAEAYKASVIAKAEGEASRFDQVREEYAKAPQVTRDRLYLDMVQNVLGNSSKMVLDQKQGGSVMYLPLDKMIENSRQKSNQAQGGSSSGQNFNSSSNSPISNNNNQFERSASRSSTR